MSRISLAAAVFCAVISATPGALAQASTLAGSQVTAATQAHETTALHVTQSVTVTADRGLIGQDDEANTVIKIPGRQLRDAPGLALDDGLHAVAGFQLFRRTSSWTANPTSQGVSLRGLGSTAASRTLVVSDQVPMNDPFGGWVHWDEIPALDVGLVSVLEGGASDLYGSSAIGGVIDVVPVTAAQGHAQLQSEQGGASAAADAYAARIFPAWVSDLRANAMGATENSADGDALAIGGTRDVRALGAFSRFTTGGYIPTAPAFRGTVDTPANVSGEAARLELGAAPDVFRHLEDAFLRGNVLNEARQNGTPLQTNATRLWRYQAGADASGTSSTAALRIFGSREDYRQSFSSIAANRDSEQLTKLQRVPTDELGFALQGSREVLKNASVGVGLDLRDVKATDRETSVSGDVPGATTTTSAAQRELGGFVDALWQPHGWSFAGSVRVDSFETFHAQQNVSTSAALAPLPSISDLIASPHLGVLRYFGRDVALTANAFRAFRGPTMNELYRSSQVGQQLTLPNHDLRSERATGFEFGGSFRLADFATLRTTYFWTEVNRPVSTVLLSETATSQTYQRENLGQIRSRGLMVQAQSFARGGFDATIGYQLAIATVTAFNTSEPLQNNLTGKWIPEVPRESVVATANYRVPRVVSFHLIASYQGHEFDDAENQFLLHPFARFDLSADRTLKHGFSVYAGAQNLLNRTIDAGETPVLTLAAPRLVEGGIRYSFDR